MTFYLYKWNNFLTGLPFKLTLYPIAREIFLESKSYLLPSCLDLPSFPLTSAKIPDPLSSLHCSHIMGPAHLSCLLSLFLLSLASILQPFGILCISVEATCFLCFLTLLLLSEPTPITSLLSDQLLLYSPFRGREGGQGVVHGIQWEDTSVLQKPLPCCWGLSEWIYNDRHMLNSKHALSTRHDFPTESLPRTCEKTGAAETYVYLSTMCLGLL